MVDIYGSHSKHPSFSSTLLDAIYRSIDQGSEEKMVACGEAARRKKELHEYCNSNMVGGVLIQRKEVSGKVDVRENHISSSWDSSSGGGGAGTGASGGSGLCASFDGDSFYGKRLKPIRVWDSGLDKDEKLIISDHEKPVKNQEGFSKKSSRALKKYAGLKKVKQPISPGAARLAGFLSSLFSSTSKKPTIINNPDINSPILKSADSSTCSSASSFSRSCLSKAPSCRGKPNGGGKRSVRFSPVSVILNQNSESCGNKSSPKAIIKHRNQKLETAKNSDRNSDIPAPNVDEQMVLHAKEMKKKVEEAARDLLRNYQKKMDREFPFDLKKSHINNQMFTQEFDEESEEDDDAASYASSDLFELDNLSAIGMQRFELPVYETTRLPPNGLIL